VIDHRQQLIVDPAALRATYDPAAVAERYVALFGELEGRGRLR
jgi:hypothetical protein